MSLIGPSRTAGERVDVCFSNRPFGVKRYRLSELALCDECQRRHSAQERHLKAASAVSP
jgi:hypothetical protein